MHAPQNQSQDDGRRSRFAFDHHSALGGFRDSSLPAALREPRAASQPPRHQMDPPSSVLPQRRFESPYGAPGTPPPSIAPNSGPWSPSRHASFHVNQSSSPSSASALVGNFPARSAPIRSLSFSTSQDLPSRFHPFMRESFPSTFEDDEDEFDALTDISGIGAQDASAQAVGGSMGTRGSHAHSTSIGGSYDPTIPIRGTRAAALAAADNMSRSRSQSLAAISRRQMPMGIAPSMSNSGMVGATSSGMLHSWSESVPGNTRGSGIGSNSYFNGSRTTSTPGNVSGNMTDLSNMSPFVRDIGQIMDDTPAFRELWASASGFGPFGGEDGGGSGATSRRHSVSIVQPRTRRSSTVAGFSGSGIGLGTAIEDEDDSPPLHHMDQRHTIGAARGQYLRGNTLPSRENPWSSGSGTDLGSGLVSGNFAMGRFGGSGGRSMISDDELAGDLNSLSLNVEGYSRPQPPGSRRPGEGPIHPSSLPIYALAKQMSYQQPLSQSPAGSAGERGITPVNGDSAYGGGTAHPDIQASSPSLNQPLSARDHNTPIRRPSASPNRMSGRAMSRERSAGLDTVPVSRGPGETSPTGYRSSQGPLSSNFGAGVFAGQGQPQGAISPTSQRMSSPLGSTGNGHAGSPGFISGQNVGRGTSGTSHGRPGYGFSPVTTPISPPAPTVFNPSRSGSIAAPSGSAVLPPQIQTNLGMRSGPSSAGGFYPKSPLERVSTQSQLRQSTPGTQTVTNYPGATQLSGPQVSPTNSASLNELGRGVPLHRISAATPMYIIEFKAGRSDLFFCDDPTIAAQLAQDDWVIVEADRGKDLGRIVKSGITSEDVESFQRLQIQKQSMMMGGQGEDDDAGASPVRPPYSKELMPKRLYAKATQQDLELLVTKGREEAKALQLCQNKVRAKNLPMEVVEAEYQWDRRKLTFYFVSDRRIDFRELVRELFRLYKTRIWMACLQGPSAVET
ncbi:hypothetical protein FRB99_007363 [Tulasnella sp. 403]|nr:hypothetical protein FRB99_007363 [Tulasnella sp. 403]